LIAFLAPAFLIGLIALAVPVLIHLVQRERSRALSFPSLMFLRRVTHHSVRRRRLRHWWLLALRCAAISLLAAAFARPVWTAAGDGPTGVAGATARVLVVDRSFSMGYGEHWRRAVAEAKRELDEVAAGDLMALVLFGRGAAAGSGWTTDPDVLIERLDSAAPNGESTRFAPALELASRLLAESGLQRREVVLISDFQKRALDGVEGVRLPAGTRVRWVRLDAREAHHVGITELKVRRVYEAGRERVAVTARVTRQGDSTAPVAAALEVGGRELETRQISFGAENTQRVEFASFALPNSGPRGVVKLEGEAWPEAFHFMLSPSREIRVMLVSRDEARAAESLYVRRALAIGDRPRYDVRVIPRSRLTASDLEGVHVVLLNDAAWPKGAVGAALRGFVEAGGGVIASLGRNAASDWPAAAAEVVPGRMGRLVDREAESGATLGYLDYTHPSLALFSRPRSGDFSQARFLRYRTLDGVSEGIHARYDDGGVALVEVRLGAGRTLFWTSSLDTLWNDLPLQPVFLPFLHRLVMYAADYEEVPLWHTVGDVLPLGSSDAAGTETQAWSGVDPTGERLTLARGDTVLTLEQAGFYEFRLADTGRTRRIAVNVDPAETDLTSVDPEELAATLERSSEAVGTSERTLTRPEREQRQAGWWFLLLGVALLLAVETLLSNQLSKAAR
jgi:hypothetical protein